MTSKALADRIAKLADDAKALHVETLDIRKKTSIADYFVICTGTSERHVESIADRVSEQLRDEKMRPLRVEGERSGWVVLDFGEVILHVMLEEQRQFYDLETLWKLTHPDPNLVE
jgi:ribosome-associated protein